MTQVEPFVREAGSGPGVVCTHSNASTSGQWRDLLELLAPDFHVLACDSYGAGRSPEWPSKRALTLADEAQLLEPVLKRAGPGPALVGHSYGAAVPRRWQIPAAYVRWRCTSPRSSRWTQATRTRPQRASSTTGWEPAAGNGSRRSAAHPSPPRWGMCAVGDRRCLPSQRSWRRSATSTSRAVPDRWALDALGARGGPAARRGAPAGGAGGI